MEPDSPKPRSVKVAKVPKTGAKEDEVMRMLATLCYFYPQYTFAQARKLPYRRVAMLIAEAHRQEAIRYYNLTQIMAAPHTKKGEGVRKRV